MPDQTAEMDARIKTVRAFMAGLVDMAMVSHVGVVVEGAAGDDERRQQQERKAAIIVTVAGALDEWLLWQERAAASRSTPAGEATIFGEHDCLVLALREGRRLFTGCDLVQTLDQTVELLEAYMAEAHEASASDLTTTIQERAALEMQRDALVARVRELEAQLGVQGEAVAGG